MRRLSPVVLAFVALTLAAPAQGQQDAPVYVAVVSDRLLVGDGRYHVYRFDPALMDPDAQWTQATEVLMSWSETLQRRPDPDDPPIAVASISCWWPDEAPADATLEAASWGESRFLILKIAALSARRCELFIKGFGARYFDYNLSMPSSFNLRLVGEDGRVLSARSAARVERVAAGPWDLAAARLAAAEGEVGPCSRGCLPLGPT